MLAKQLLLQGGEPEASLAQHSNMVMDLAIAVPFQKDRQEQEGQRRDTTALCCCQSSKETGSNLRGREVSWGDELVAILAHLLCGMWKGDQICPLGFSHIFHTQIRLVSGFAALPAPFLAPLGRGDPK